MCGEQFLGIDETELKLPVDEIIRQTGGFKLDKSGVIFRLGISRVDVKALYSLRKVVEERFLSQVCLLYTSDAADEQ